MTHWHFQRRVSEYQSIDAANLRRSWLSDQSIQQIESLPLIADGQSISLGELFDVCVEPSEFDLVTVKGDLASVHGLAAAHDRGPFRIIGNVGNHLGSGMTGGSVSVEGDAGDFLAGPLGARKTGMSGGEITITGQAGNHVGHRMRRGTVMVGGAVGDLLAASMIAGTICVGGTMGDQLAVGMKRGTVILANALGLVRQADSLDSRGEGRFSSPVRFDPGFLSLYKMPGFQDLVHPLWQLPVFRTRADRNVGGLGEIIFPATPELALAE